ncbi:ProFAR isomerase associated superfamily [Clostridium tetani]|uniref:ASCH domain-containing protein n=1 Tax=Clostridium tetani TaxID=1513 RepID=A0ABY0EQJ3_CLOTA|nr:ASCH domain-containing protein [Clostridium tetani]AVP53581.1 ASCH domain-containing protein [Clostridium tetani]KHO39481.1 hypothetical protein OR62_05695 [Clostridium tetani]RXI53373.1 ASCH domain-containing protein [Clostridium tetani]RXI67267.1 ASCH domain-containing protein [Clostridium tetani]RXI75180.1 ASCH domain-containing protein [Clostridium tetani]
MIYKMKLKEEEFNNIKYSNKIMEVRLYDEKRRKINIGDKIIFYKIPCLEENIIVDIENIYKFSTFKELYDAFPKSFFGYNSLSINEIISKIYSIYTIEQEEKYGVIAIKFKVINKNNIKFLL